MTNSRSRSSRSKLLGALVVACAMVGAAGVAHAERKRVVVLDFEGPKGERFHDDVVRLLKKTHTVVSTHQWNGAAEQLDAASMLDKDVRRVAKKLKVDAVVEGKIEKRRDAFLIHLKLREGKTGEVVRAGISTRADGPRIEGRAQRDIKDELVGAIDEVEPNHPGDDDDDDRGKKRVAKAEAEADDEAEERPTKKRGKKADDRGKKRVAKAEAEAEDEGESDRSAKKAKKDSAGKKVAKKTEEEDEDSLPPKKASKADKADERAGKKVAKKTEEEGEDSLPPKKANKAKSDERSESVGGGNDGKRFSKRPEDERGSDRVASADDERAALKPKTDDDAAAKAGEGDGDEGHKAASTKVASSEDAERVEVEAEPAGRIESAMSRSPGQRAIELIAGGSMTVRTMKFDVKGDLVSRPANYKGGRAGGAIVDATIYPLALRSRAGILKDIGVTVMYDRMLKVSSRSQLTGMEVDTKETRLGAGLVFRHAFGSTPTAPVVLAKITYSSQVFRIAADLDTPNVKYTMFEPGLGVRVPVIANLVLGLDAKFMAITNTGQIQELSQYGTARVLGLEGALSVDYLFGRGLFARAAFRYETIGYTFKGNGLMTVNRDRNASTQDVMGARDSYLGGLASVGYLY